MVNCLISFCKTFILSLTCTVYLWGYSRYIYYKSYVLMIPYFFVQFQCYRLTNILFVFNSSPKTISWFCDWKNKAKILICMFIKYIIFSLITLHRRIRYTYFALDKKRFCNCFFGWCLDPLLACEMKIIRFPEKVISFLHNFTIIQIIIVNA